MHYFTDVVKKYAVFDGRARRKEYWMFFLINLIIVMVLSILENAIGLKNVLSTLYALAMFLPSLGVGIRRLHDTNRSGWWVLVGIIPIIGAIVLIVLLALDSQPGDNQYGPNPKEKESAPAETVVTPEVPPTTTV